MMIAREIVQRIWRKMHSPGPSGDQVKALEEFSTTRNRAKTTGFSGVVEAGPQVFAGFDGGGRGTGIKPSPEATRGKFQQI